MRLRFALTVAIALLLRVDVGAGEPGTFQGEVIVRWIQESGDDRSMELVEPFSFVDPNGLEWPVPVGAIIDGASIPRIFWTMIGPPFVGDYRYASVVHDYHCKLRKRSWQEVHRMFGDACVAGGVGALKAGLMFLAVRERGPRWPRGVGLVPIPEPRRLTNDEMKEIQEWIEKENPSLDEIRAAIDAKVSASE